MKQMIVGFLVLFFVSLSCISPALAEKPPEGMVLIQGGCFKMGTDKVFHYLVGGENIGERPAHKVCPDSFFLDKTEVTQKKWDEIMDSNNAPFQGPDLPITHIMWEEARSYCAQRGFRLPTEAEWEYAARAGNEGDNPWGESIDGDYLWYVGNSSRRLANVGTKKPNAWGVYDMIGSVWEWVEDWYSDHYYSQSPEKNPKGPKTRQSWRVIRGGSWVDEEEMIRVTARFRGESDSTEDFWVGFRCAATPEKKTR